MDSKKEEGFAIELEEAQNGGKDCWNALFHSSSDDDLDNSSENTSSDEDEDEDNISIEKVDNNIYISSRQTGEEKERARNQRIQRKSMATLPSRPKVGTSGPLHSKDLSPEEKYATDFMSTDGICRMLLTKPCCKRLCLHSVFRTEETMSGDLTPVIALVQECRQQLIGIVLILQLYIMN